MISVTFTLAIFTAAVSAAEWNQGYNNGPSYGPSYGGYGNYNGGYSPSYGYGGYQGGHGGHGGHYGNGFQAQVVQATDVWGNVITHEAEEEEDEEPAEPVVDPKAGWYNQWQQYSNPLVEYNPVWSYQHIYALCELEGGNVQFAQMSNHAPLVMADFTGLSTEVDYKFVIKQYGVIGEECTAPAGKEFNPLAEIWEGVENPHADPTRGRIDGFTTDDAGVGSIKQNPLLQNLSGKDSIIGKSLHLFAGEAETASACCVIGQAKVPEPLKKKEATYVNLNDYNRGHRGHGHGYGGW